MSYAESPAPVLGLRRPDLAEVRACVARSVNEPEMQELWLDLLSIVGLSGTETDPESLERLLDVMMDADRVLRLCALSVRIRLQTYQQMVAIQTAIGRLRP